MLRDIYNDIKKEKYNNYAIKALKEKLFQLY